MQEENREFHEGRVDVFRSLSQEHPGIGAGDFTCCGRNVQFEEFGYDRNSLFLSSGLDYRIGKLSSTNIRAGYTNYEHGEFFNRSAQFRTTNLSGTYITGEDTLRFNLDPASEALLDPSTLIAGNGPVLDRTGFDFDIPYVVPDL